MMFGIGVEDLSVEGRRPGSIVAGSGRARNCAPLKQSPEGVTETYLIGMQIRQISGTKIHQAPQGPTYGSPVRQGGVSSIRSVGLCLAWRAEVGFDFFVERLQESGEFLYDIRILVGDIFGFVYVG